MGEVAVVGSGMAGTIAALELAGAGWDVDLYEADQCLLNGASRWNEGKIHLGFVYAMDRTLRTARTMISGASAFYPLLSTYVPREVIAAAASTPFYYAVPRGSMASVAQVEAHFADVERLLASHQVPAPLVATEEASRRLSAREMDALFDPGLVEAAFATAEVAIDPAKLAPHLRDAVEAHTRIRVLTGHRVDAFRILDEDVVRVTASAGDDVLHRDYRRAVNASWWDRIALDRTAGITPPQTVMHRYKVGLHGSVLGTAGVSATFLVGSFGDVVSFADRSYLSWYPTGLLATSREVRPPSSARVLGELDAAQVRRSAVREIGRLMPTSAVALEESSRQSRVAGGWITAWGSTGIEDPASRLHERHEVGVHVHGPLISVDSGKFTTAPLFGHQAAQSVIRAR